MMPAWFTGWFAKGLMLLAILAALSGLVFGLDRHGYVRGKAEAEAANEKEKTKAIDEAMADQHGRGLRSSAIDARAQQQQAAIQTKFVPIDREVIRYVQIHSAPDDCALDPDGMRLWNAANGGQLAGEQTGAHGAAVPGAAAAPQDGSAGGAAGQPRAGDEGLPRMPRAQSREGGVDREGGAAMRDLP